jgi:hypothetical protein
MFIFKSPRVHRRACVDYENVIHTVVNTIMFSFMFQLVGSPERKFTCYDMSINTHFYVQVKNLNNMREIIV